METHPYVLFVWLGVYWMTPAPAVRYFREYEGETAAVARRYSVIKGRLGPHPRAEASGGANMFFCPVDQLSKSGLGVTLRCV